MELNFSISELCIEDSPIPLSVADKLLEHHIKIIQPIRQYLGFPIWASERSGYRSIDYEKAKGRSGESQHTFIGKGAVDWTCKPDRLLDLLGKLYESEYIRICLYPNKRFIHCDYAGAWKQFYICKDGTTWERTDYDSFIWSHL